MELHLRDDPSPALRGSVRRLAGWYERVEHPVVRRELPGGRIVLVISFGPPLEVDGRSYGSFVAGMHETAAITEHAGVSHGIQAYLTPLGAERLFGMPMGELAGGGADLTDVLGPEAAELAERLYEAPGWAARFALFERFIAARVADGPRVPPELEWAWGRLLASDGAVPVGALADEVGWSRRHLAARFREHIGLPPKALARVLRFERAAQRVRDGAGLPDVALDSGYYDQAHFNRDFRAFAGVTPTEYQVTSVQDIQSVPA
jgi:AraC-like DNA-binding protein